jgi:hypothetical protein
VEGIYETKKSQGKYMYREEIFDKLEELGNPVICLFFMTLADDHVVAALLRGWAEIQGSASLQLRVTIHAVHIRK